MEWLLPGMSPADVLDDWVARGAALVAVTLGADGVLAATAGGLRTRLPGRPVHVVDTVGAGDTFSAALLAGLHDAGLLGVDARPALRAIGPDVLHEVLDGAVRAAAITCSRRGADPPTAAELAAAH
ncbi:PfkB family carbohydrate kinase [Pseudonocardia benzenivorans]